MPRFGTAHGGELAAALAHRLRDDRAGGHVAAVLAQVADTGAEARRLLRTQLPRWLGPGLAGYVPVDGRERPVRDPDGYAELLCRIHPVGTVRDCAESMAATAQSSGIDHLICMVEGAGDPAAVHENIARLGAEVLPLLPGRDRLPVRGTGAAAAPADGERGGSSRLR